MRDPALATFLLDSMTKAWHHPQRELRLLEDATGSPSPVTSNTLVSKIKQQQQKITGNQEFWEPSSTLFGIHQMTMLQADGTVKRVWEMAFDRDTHPTWDNNKSYFVKEAKLTW